MSTTNVVRRWLLAALWLAVFGAASAAAAAPRPEQAVELVQETFHEATAALPEHRQRIKTDPRAAKQLMQEILAPHVDFQLLSKLVLARHWRTATPAERERFVAAFRGSLLDTYALVLSQNIDEIIKQLEQGRELLTVKPVRPSQDARRIVVETQMNLGGRTVSVDYRLHASGQEWQVYDVIIEGVSFVTSRRSEFAGLLQRQSLEQLIRQLESRA